MGVTYPEGHRMIQLPDDRQSPHPSAIDELIAQKPIGEMTPDEYLTMTRQAQNALADVDRIRREIRDGIAKCRIAASRTRALLESPLASDKRTA
jgi:hypothetical protein